MLFAIADLNARSDDSPLARRRNSVAASVTGRRHLREWARCAETGRLERVIERALAELGTTRMRIIRESVCRSLVAQRVSGSEPLLGASRRARVVAQAERQTSG